MPGWPAHPGGAIWAQGRAGLLAPHRRRSGRWAVHSGGGGAGDGRQSSAATSRARLHKKNTQRHQQLTGQWFYAPGWCRNEVQHSGRTPPLLPRPPCASQGRAAVLETKECGPQGLPGGHIASVMARRVARRVPSVRASAVCGRPAFPTPEPLYRPESEHAAVMASQAKDLGDALLRQASNPRLHRQRA
jgi:hypothetical protein